MDTPLLFLIFNRPDTTRAVFERIREMRPAQLFVAADGPRADKPDDSEKCRRAREIALKVDWPCEVKTLLRDRNLGCKVAVSSAIDWFFASVEQGIILEDDTLPDASFFPFCRELLIKYKDDGKVAMITADNFIGAAKPGSASYYFSKIPLIWGWAAWKRSWRAYDVSMASYPAFRAEGKIHSIWKNDAVAAYWTRQFDEAYAGKIDTWDIQWAYALLANDMKSIAPALNLATNIGFGADATHTKNTKSGSAGMNALSMNFPLIHPENMDLNIRADASTLRRHFGILRTARQRALWRFKKAFPATHARLKKYLKK